MRGNNSAFLEQLSCGFRSAHSHGFRPVWQDFPYHSGVRSAGKIMAIDCAVAVLGSCTRA